MLPQFQNLKQLKTAISYLGLSPDLVISAGGENFILYVIDKKGKISKAITGNKCASGTGEFFLQQIKRMDLSVDDAITLGTHGEPYNISEDVRSFVNPIALML